MVPDPTRDCIIAAPSEMMVEASRMMKQGLALVAGGPSADAVAQALVCFDRALDLRRRLPVDEFPVRRYDLAACWLNRGEALARLGDAGRIKLAIEAYDQGITLLASLPLAEDPRFPRRLAIAHQNRGLALHALDPRSSAAIEPLLAAIAILEHGDAASIADRHYLLAAATVNLARATLSAGAPRAASVAHHAVLRALGLIGPLEADDADAAQVGLTARHLLCQVIAGRGLPDPASAPAISDEVHEATDLADEGLALVRRWEQRGINRFRPIAADLFRFGAQVYGIYQPQFLTEFVYDQLDPGVSSADYVNSDEMRAATRDLLRVAEPSTAGRTILPA